MYKMVQDLSRDELNELKSSFFYQDETQDINESTFSTPEEIPDEIIFEHYDGVYFVKEDFFCNIKDGNYENCGGAYQGI